MISLIYGFLVAVKNFFPVWLWDIWAVTGVIFWVIAIAFIALMYGTTHKG